MSDTVKPVPDGFRTVTPSLTIQGASRAIEFYKAALGAEELVCMNGPGGSIMHAELRIGDSIIFLNDEMPTGCPKSPTTLGGTSVSLNLYVADVDASHARAVAAGAESVMPPADMFWGDRFAHVMDPFGHSWSFATHVEDVSPEEMRRRMEAFFADMPAMQPV